MDRSFIDKYNEALANKNSQIYAIINYRIFKLMEKKDEEAPKK